MADNKFQVIKKSLSSWSLSTVKKPTISIPKFKKPKIKIFTGKKKTKSEEDKKEVSKQARESESFQSNEPPSQTVIHDPRKKDGSNHHPYIILTVPGESSTDDPHLPDGDANNQETSEEDIRDYSEHVEKQDTKPSISDVADENNIDNKGSNVSSKCFSNSIKFIDDDENDHIANNNDETHYNNSSLGITSDEYYSWFDAEGPSLQSLQKEKNRDSDISNEEYANYIASEYFDASESRTITPSGRSYEDIEFPEASDRKLPGSVKAREWVKSFDEKNIDYEINKNEGGCIEEIIPRSKSEVQLNTTDIKKSKNEIILNTNKNGSISSVKQLFSKFLPKNDKNQNNSRKESSNGLTKSCEEIEELERRESMRKIFGVRGKVSLKTTVIDSNFFKDSDIHMASVPLALTNSIKSSVGEYRESKDSLDNLEDNEKENSIHCSSDNISTKEEIVDETEELMKEIEKYLSDTDYIGEVKSSKTVIQESISQTNLQCNEANDTNEHTDISSDICIPQKEEEGFAEITSKNILPKSIVNENEESNDCDKHYRNIDAGFYRSESPCIDVVIDEDININSNSNITIDTHDEIFTEKENAINRENHEGSSNIVGQNTALSVENNEDSPITVKQNTAVSVEIQVTEKSLNEDKIKKAGTYITNSLKSLKENIMSPENKDLTKLKDEWKKKKSKLNPFRQKTKLKNNEIIASDQKQVENLESEPANNVIDEQFGDGNKPDDFCSFTGANGEGFRKITGKKHDDSYCNKSNNINITTNSNNLEESDPKLHKVQIHSDSIEEEEKFTNNKETKENESKILASSNENSFIIQNEEIKELSLSTSDISENNSHQWANNLMQKNVERADIKYEERKEEYKYAFVAKPLIVEIKPIVEIKSTNDMILNGNKDSEILNIEILKSNEIEETCAVYENEVFKFDKDSQCQETPSVQQCQEAPPPILPRTVISKPIMDSKTTSVTKPRPTPRSKKSKYGYAKQVPTSSNSGHLYSVNEERNSTNNVNNFVETEDILNSSHGFDETKEPTMKIRNENRNSFTEENTTVNEPIYWEIGDSLAVPTVTPRRKKDKSPRISPNSSTSEISGSSELPEWIQLRPPIPSPRNKKQKSTQSLVQDAQNESTDDVHKLKNVNVFGSSYTNLNFDVPKQRNGTKWSGEDFYSGKAASISYGMTSRINSDYPPVLQQRSKKPSLTSLPGTIPNNEQSPFVRYITPPSELHKKRIRRKTSPAIQPQETPAQKLKTHLNPLQILEESLHYFMQIVTSVSEPNKNQSKSEELLSDVLFSVSSVMGQDVANTWSIVAPDANKQDDKGINVTLGQVRSHLREAFQVSPAQFDEILQEILKREAVNVTLTVKIIEASELRVKTVKGGSNPFVTVTVPGSNQSHRTRTEHETLSPKWQQEFNMKVKNLNKDVLKLEVWHDLDPNFVNQVSAVKDLKSLQRLVKGTSALAQKQETHLLGSVQIPIKDIRENGINKWFILAKENLKEEGKERGQIHIEAFVAATDQGIPPSESRKSHDALLAKLIYHHIKTVSNNNSEEGSFHIPWHGQLCPEANAAIAQHAIILGLPPAQQHLSWWLVGSRVPSSDGGWQLKHLKIIQSHMNDSLYGNDDMDSLADSFSDWTEYSLLKLRNLKKNFPPTSGILAKHQLASLLAIFVALDCHKESSSLLEKKEIRDVLNLVREAVADYMKVWWTKLIEDQLKGETIPEHQIQKIVIITSEVYYFLCEIAAFYSPSLLKEMNIPYFREMYLMITRKLNPCVRPPLMNVYNHLENVSELTFPEEDENKISTLTLEDGTNLWQLYMNMGRLYKLGFDLPLEVRQESGIYEYHKWFNKAVKRWVELAKTKAELMIEKAVKLDDFEPIDEYNNFSSSATDVSGIFTDVQIWWQKLEWPDPENSMILLARILEDICSYGMRYADLLKQKVELMFSVQSHSDQLVISKPICTGLNNIERIRDELTRLPVKFGVRMLIENIKQSQTGGEDAAERFRLNIDTLVEISSENMERKVNEFIEAVMEKMRSTLHHAVIQACEASSEKSLFTEVLDPALQLLHKNMSDNNFRRFLQRLWEVLIELFHINVTRNTDKRKASYFNGIYYILNASAKFFSPCEEVGLTKEGIHTQEYIHLIELLECLRLSSENLISRYYNERYEEQKLLNAQSKGELVVRVFFTKAGKLVVEVIMAKDLQLQHETGSFNSKNSYLGGQNQQVDSYVKVQIMPLEWFPAIHEVKTKTMRNSDPAVFEEGFEFELKNDDDGVSNGFLLFTIKDYHLGRSNTFIGESVIPLQDLQCIDSSSVHTVPNIYLKITQPGMECGYASLRALRLRTADKVAYGFLKKIQPRLSDSRQRSGCAALSSDEEKPRSKSPRLLQKLGLS